LKYMLPVESWTINWCFYDNIVNLDIVTAATSRNDQVQQATDLDVNTANTIIFFRTNMDANQRELRIIKMEGTAHPIHWLPFTITQQGIELL
jgi:KaiC/GvpD/RAD55 family RecA-like ATPase